MVDRLFLFFFFQAEDGIRDLIVTGVQTCALPISGSRPTFDNKGQRRRFSAERRFTRQSAIRACGSGGACHTRRACARQSSCGGGSSRRKTRRAAALERNPPRFGSTLFWGRNHRAAGKIGK